MTQMLETAIRFFEENEWAYVREGEEPALQASFRGDSGEWPCYAFADEEQQRFSFYSVCPVHAPEDKLMAVAELVTRINYGMAVGNFELDFEDGEVRFRTSIDVEGDRLSAALVERLAMTNVAVMDIYLPGIMKVIYSDIAPAEVVAQIDDECGCDHDDGCGCNHEH